MSETNSENTTDEKSESNRTLVLEQGGETHEIEPLSYQDQSVEEFYNYRGVRASAKTPIDIEQGAQKSKLFLYEDSEGLSLVIIHDDHNYPRSTANGGEVVFTFDGLDGSWAIKDDPGDWNRWRTSPPEKIHWQWNNKNTDGGVFRFDSDDFTVTVNPDFRSGISEWEVLSGSPSKLERFDLQMDEEISIKFSGKEKVTASATTLQFIPGKEENPSKGGHPLNSGLMQIFPEDGRWGIWGAPVDANTDPVYDNWLGGDMIDELPETLDEARKPKEDKYADDSFGEFKQYRLENGVRVSFEASDGSIDRDTVEIEFSETGPSGSDPVISRGDQENSKTVLHDHSINGIPWEDWYGGENVRTSRREPRYYEYDTDFEFEGVEGVRVVTVWGGWAGFMGDISARAGNDPADFLGEVWDWGFARQTLLNLALMSAPLKVNFFLEAITTIPRTWSFVDFVVLADGRRYVRVWDASQYPSLYTYVDGVLKSREDMAYETNQLWNWSMFAFLARATVGATPYNNPATLYLRTLTPSPLSLEIEREIDTIIDRLNLGWTASELMPTVPRETLGFDGDASATDTKPVGDSDDPFPSIEGMLFPTEEKLPSV